MAEDEFMNARGLHTFIADKIHLYCTYKINTEYRIEMGKQEEGEQRRKMMGKGRQKKGAISKTDEKGGERKVSIKSSGMILLQK